MNTIHNIDFGNNPDKGYENPVYDASSIIRTSDDNGITWDNVTSKLSVTLRSVFYGNNSFEGVGVSRNIVRSPDNDASWDNATSPTSNHLRGVTFFRITINLQEV